MSNGMSNVSGFARPLEGQPLIWLFGAALS